METREHLEKIEREISGLLSPSRRSLYDPAKYLLKLGGKRIRPLLSVLGHALYEKPHPDIYKIAAAIEVFHNSTLVHDDIMDEAPLRRGKPSVHSRFGAAQAILTGDAMIIEAFRSISSLENNNRRGVLIETFSNLGLDVCLGQQLDLDFEARKEVPLPEYLEMIRLKSAVLIGGSLQLGALYAQAPSKEIELLYKAGEALGMVFQIQDDYLDAFGGEGFGKKTGGDILASKKTYLFVKTLQTLPSSERNEFIELYTSSSSDKLAQVMAIFNRLNLKEEVNIEIQARYQEAIMPLRIIVGDKDVKQALIELIEGLFQRKM